MAASYGHIGQIDHPESQEAIDLVIRKTRAAGKILGV
jgi:2-keto-3-deoxy-L-rhamnonate aldolase RhmA